MSFQYLVSTCLIGESVRYDGGHALQSTLKTLVESGQAIAFCPEIAGGLPTPRPPAEIQKHLNRLQVVDITGEDVTHAFELGATKALNLMQKYGIQMAILKANSPSCGSGKIYDGSFSGQKINGDGITTQLLKQYGMTVMSEDEFLKHHA